MEPFYKELIDTLLEGSISNKQELQNLKLKLCAKHSFGQPPTDAQILANVPNIHREKLLPLLRTKSTRTLSGVAVVAAMTSPHECPHGKCVFCPGGPEVGTPQSYTGFEPAAMRGKDNDFDPYRQTRSRLEQLQAIGHSTDKVDLIIMGGTFTAREPEYQASFVKGCLDAMNELGSASDQDDNSVERAKPSTSLEMAKNAKGGLSLEMAKDLETAKQLNADASNRCIGLTVETRPDYFLPKHIDYALTLGATRVELGVQVLDDYILASVQRGHNVQQTIQATIDAKDAGLKVCYHLMPGLPGMTPEMDMLSFENVFYDPDFKPDMLKIYPCLVVEGSDLHKQWQQGLFKPYDTATLIELLADIMAAIPPWIRIQRVQRDIPVGLVPDGLDVGNLHQLVLARLSEQGKSCGCIRCREAGMMAREGTDVDLSNLTLETMEYPASNGTEHFLTYVDKASNALAGYLRLRIPSKGVWRKELYGRDCGIVRELKVVGEAVPLGQAPGKKLQHRHIGSELLEVAEELLRNKGFKRCVVNHGIGTLRYYEKKGYSVIGDYVVKGL